MTTQSNTTAITTGEQITNLVSTRVHNYVSQNRLQLPPNYSVDNALRSAMLMIPDIKDANKVPVLKSCSRESIENALLDMCIQGMNPNKKQCYFIAYGSKLIMQRSWYGEVAAAKAVNPDIEDIFSEVVFEGDKFEYVIKRGKIVEITHSQKLENKNKNIIAAYATVVYKNGKEESTVMTWEQIKKSWAKSPQNPLDQNGNVKSGSTHDQFSEEMAKRTVVRRACKPIINSSDDSNLMTEYIKKSADETDAIEVGIEIEENANKTDLPVMQAEDDAPMPAPEKKVVEAEFTEDPF